MSTQIEWHSDISAAPKDKRIFMIADAFIPSRVGHSPDLVVARWNKNLSTWETAQVVGEQLKDAPVKLRPLYWADVGELPPNIALD
jgi:hypothetical protein